MGEMRQIREYLEQGNWEKARIFFGKSVKQSPAEKSIEAKIDLLSSLLDVTGAVDIPIDWKLGAKQSDIPQLAKDKRLLAKVESIVQKIPTKHVLALGDSAFQTGFLSAK